MSSVPPSSPKDPSADDHLKVGAQLGPYLVLGVIGAGGMGQVFRARDTRLDRIVAIKASATQFSGRFEGEARTVASLNHPNICTIHDVGPNYLVMEYVEGATLHQLLAERQLQVEEILSYAAQIAAAMSAAHAAGVVHRDLKPSNVMVTGTGLVKVLDFGLAKMIRRVAAVAETDPTATFAASSGHTLAGTIMGSPAYMSPEQARGRPLDARSDIFSFGSLLYEMLTGQKAFQGDSALEALSGILHLEVPPPSATHPEIGTALDPLVARCLRKDPAQRFQSMAEVQSELKALADGTSGTVSIKRKRARQWARWALMAAGVGAIAAAGSLVWRSVHLGSPEEGGGAPEVTRVTFDPGLSVDPAISPDGKLVAYASDRSGEGNLDIWVRQIGGGDPIRLTRDSADDVEPSFSPDGTHVIFRSGRNGGGLYIVPTLGGEERKVADGGRRPQFSPDGTKVAYWTGPAMPFPLRGGSGKTYVIDLATSTTRRIRADFAAAVHPVWSPDGKKILFVGAKGPADAEGWWITPLNDEPAVLCPAMPPGDLFDPFAWEGERVYFEWDGTGPRTITWLTVNAATGKASGKPRRLTASTADAYSPSVSKTGQVVFSVVETTTNLYGLPLDTNKGKSTGGLQRLSKLLGLNEVRSISADGIRLAFISDRMDDRQIWGEDLATGHEHALTEGGKAKAVPLISPDGRWVAWKESWMASREAFVTSFDSGTTQKLCSNCGAVQAWSPDGRFLLYDQGLPRRSVGLMEFSSGKVTPYLKSPDLDLRVKSVSRDGKWIALTASRSATEFTIYAAPFSPERTPLQSEWVAVISSPDAHPNPSFSPDGRLLYFTSERDGYNCIWAQRLNQKTKHPEGPLFPVQHFHAPSLRLVAPSFQDGVSVPLAANKIAVSLAERTGGIWMLKLPGDR